jgi:SAM-dependent methyltransferase
LPQSAFSAALASPLIFDYRPSSFASMRGFSGWPVRSLFSLESSASLRRPLKRELLCPAGKVIGVDMTHEQRAKANRLRDGDQFANVIYLKGYIENVPYEAASVDAVISNGVINLAPDKSKVFSEVYRLLKPGGR